MERQSFLNILFYSIILSKIARYTIIDKEFLNTQHTYTYVCVYLLLINYIVSNPFVTLWTTV